MDRFAHQRISKYELDDDTYEAAIDALGVKAVVELSNMSCMGSEIIEGSLRLK